jgi:hypothetical protein
MGLHSRQPLLTVKLLACTSGRTNTTIQDGWIEFLRAYVMN